MLVTRALLAVVGAACLLVGCRGNVFDLEVGACFDDPAAAEEVTEVPVVDCADPHDNEVYAAFDLPDGPFPGVDELGPAADAGCRDRFEDWVGVASEQSRLVIGYLAPSEAGWDDLAEREVLCYVSDIEGEPLRGSAEGSGR